MQIPITQIKIFFFFLFFLESTKFYFVLSSHSLVCKLQLGVTKNNWPGARGWVRTDTAAAPRGSP